MALATAAAVGLFTERVLVSRSCFAAAGVVLSPLMEGLERRVRDCNDGAALLQESRPWVIPGVGALGLVLPKAAAELARFPDVFKVTPDSVELVAGKTAKERSEAVAGVLQQLREEGCVPMLSGWRNEAWPVKASFHAPAALVVERAAGPLLGVRGFGSHVNGLVLKGWPDEDWLWVAKRAATKQTYPGKLDHLVAGGLSDGEKPGENVIRECAEEACIPKELAAAARPASVVSYCQVDETQWGIKRDVIFCYDLELPESFRPKAGDGEVESFSLWRMKDVIKSLEESNEDWKPNVALVIIDMLLRRGYIAPEEAGYVELVQALRK